MTIIPQRDADLIANNPVVGKTVTATAGATEGTLNLSSGAMGEDYPYLIGLESRDDSAYISKQGGSDVALASPDAANLRVLAEGSIYFMVTGPDDAYVAHKRASSSDATLAATVVGRSY